MKFAFSAILALTALTSTTTAYLDRCFCVEYYQGDIWKSHIDAFIKKYQASGPNEWKIPANSNRRLAYAESPMAVGIATSEQAVTLTKQAAVDLFWELKAKRSATGCDNAGDGIECRTASRGTPQFALYMFHKEATAVTLSYLPPGPTP